MTLDGRRSMTEDCCRAAQRLLLATALPLGLVTLGAMSAHAGDVTVTGAHGAHGVNGHLGGPPATPGGPGGAATATTTTPSDSSNTATAIGGKGGRGAVEEYCTPGIGCGPLYGTPGGDGGAAASTATTSIATGPASATATSTGGAGGAGGYASQGGVGAGASSMATATSATGSASAAATSTGGRGGAEKDGVGGDASAAASARSTGDGQVQATASAAGGSGANGAPSGSASSSASARNSSGRVATTASAPSGSKASALTNAAVGSGAASLVAIKAGRAVSNAVLTPGDADIGVGAMSAGYGGIGPAVQYQATAVFDFTTSTSETLDLNLLSDNFSGIGFDSLELEVIVDGKAHVYKRPASPELNRSSPLTRSIWARSPREARPSSSNISSTTIPARWPSPAPALASPMISRPRLSLRPSV
jgi:hypothetical protein